MKKSILVNTILSIIITFLFAELFNLYHIGSIPTILTLYYLLAIFSIFEYILVFLNFIFEKLRNKEKLKLKDIIGRLLIFVALILILVYGIILDIDWLNWYAYSTPFYINVIKRSVEFLLPAIILIIFSLYLLRKNKTR